jgi:ubiquinol-cytochrome c reductase iron-sulfur subunit
MSERTALRLAVGGAILTIFSALAFVVAYLLDTPYYAMGFCATLAFAGIAVSFWAWSTGLVTPKRVVEQRDVAPQTTGAELALGQTVVAESSGLTRPELFAVLSLAAGGTLGVAALVPLRSLAFPPATEGPAKPEPWRAGVRLVDVDGAPIHHDWLTIGAIGTVFPEGAIDDPTASVVLIRLDPRVVPRARRDWSPEGYIAFSKICTHVGCPVALYRKTQHELLCPCHQSRFDVLDGARPIAGPASRPLPQLALTIDDTGVLRASHGFLEPIGPAAWGQT